MRESFGGAFMIKLVLVFIVIYISFMAVAVNYAKAFRVKNRLINLVEQHQYKEGDPVTPFEKYLEEVSYVGPYDSVNKRNKCQEGGGVWLTRGACIKPIGSKENGSHNTYYFQITTYITIDMPLITTMSLSVTGETKTYSY